MFMFMFVSDSNEISCADGALNVYLVSYDMKYHEFAIKDVSFACEKQMALYVMLGTKWT